MHLKFDEPHYRSTFKIQLTRRFKDARDFEKSNTHDNTVSDELLRLRIRRIVRSWKKRTLLIFTEKQFFPFVRLQDRRRWSSW